MPEVKIGRFRLFGFESVPEEKPKSEEKELSAILGELSDRGKLWTALEERVTKKIPTDKITKLVRVDGLTFRAIQEHIDFIVRPGFFLIGDKKIVKILNKWIEDVRLLLFLERGIRSIWRTGNAWIELGYTKDGRDIPKLKLIPDEYIDYIRDKKTDMVKLDENQEPLGFTKGKKWLGTDVQWVKDRIIVDNKVAYKAKRNEDCRDRIAHFILYDQEESYLGYTPIVSAYKSGIVRLNLEDAVGEGAFRSEGLLLKVRGLIEGVPATNEQLQSAIDDFSSISYRNVVATKTNIDVDRLPSPDLANKLELIYGLADLQACAMGVPLTLLLDPRGRGYRGDIEDKGIRFELREKALQARLAEQIRDKLLRRVMIARRLDVNKLPQVVFRSWMPQSKLNTARNRATYARRGLLRWDPEVELEIRREESLPTTFVQTQLDIWKKQAKEGKLPKSVPEASKETDVKNMDERIEEVLREHINEIIGKSANAERVE